SYCSPITFTYSPSTTRLQKSPVSARRLNDQAHCTVCSYRCTPSSADSLPYSAALSASQFRTTSSDPLTTVDPKTCGCRRTSFSRTASATSPRVKSPASSAITACINTCRSTSPSSSRSLAVDCSSIASSTS